MREVKSMKRASHALLAAAALAAGATCVAETVEVASLSVKERLRAIEVINVTAQKELDVEASAQMDAEVAAILEAAAHAEEQ